MQEVIGSIPIFSTPSTSLGDVFSTIFDILRKKFYLDVSSGLLRALDIEKRTRSKVD